MDELLRLLSTISPYKYLNESIKKDLLLTASHLEKHEKGKYVYVQGDICDSMDLIINGGVEIRSIDKDGNTRVLSSLEKGGIIGANILFSSKREYPFSVLCGEDLDIFRLSKEEVLLFSEKNKLFTQSILNIISDKTADFASWISNISFKPLREKIIDYLLSQSKIQGSREVVLPISKTELAERLGVQRTSLSREMSKLEREGLIIVKSKRIILLHFNKCASK